MNREANTNREQHVDHVPQALDHSLSVSSAAARSFWAGGLASDACYNSMQLRL
jgi:hypothetical protein